MSKYFGTDGIRGKAEKFTSKFIQKVAMGIGEYAGTGRTAESGAERPLRVLVGGDTRESTEWILRDFEEALESIGVDHGNVGVLPTPGINFAFFEMGYDLAVDVTASHNPFTDNGIKVFERGATSGRKLSAVGVEIVENAIDKYEGLEVHGAELREDLHEDALERYVRHLSEYVKKIGPASDGERKAVDFSGLRIGVDCANGATSVVGGKVFEEFGAEVLVINDDSRYGKKINRECGSTHLESLKALVLDEGLDFGVAFDGDGDRCLMVDRAGEVVDGDQIIAVLVEYLGLPSAVVTVMANEGLSRWAKSRGIELVVTDVGDQNVALAMREKGILIGGEQSGHIILPGEPMGDGLLTALVMTKVVAEKKRALAEEAAEEGTAEMAAQGVLTELASVVTKMPQVLVNAEVSEGVKRAFSEGKMEGLVEECSKKLAERGWKLLIRASGTEPLIRVTIWGDELSEITEVAEEIAGEIKEFSDD